MLCWAGCQDGRVVVLPASIRGSLFFEAPAFISCLLSMEFSMLVLFGESALSTHRLAQLESALAAHAASPVHISARAVYFVDFSAPLSVREREVLQDLFNAKLASEVPVSDDALLVVPRIGTISAWSSKATALVHGCGIDNVRRVEHGTLYTFEGGGDAIYAPAKKLIHNRMTEQVLRQVNDAKKLFAHDAPRPLRRVDVLNGGAQELRAKNRARSEERRVGKECRPCW